MARDPKIHPHWSGERCLVVASIWDEAREIGRWTFRCKQGHEWEEDAIEFSKGPLKGKPLNKMAFNWFRKYWSSASGSGVSTYCPICDPQYYRYRRRGAKKKILKS